LLACKPAGISDLARIGTLEEFNEQALLSNGISGTSAIGIPEGLPDGYPLFGVAVTIWLSGVDNPLGGDFGDVCGSSDSCGRFFAELFE
jgi:hypothetical protein